MTDAPARRLRAIRRLLDDALGRLQPRFGFRLWDGSRVPESWPADGLMVALKDEGVVSSLVRRPGLDTLVKLHVDGRIDVVNGTIFDLAEARPVGKAARALRGISKLAALDVARLFWSVDRGPVSVLDQVRGDEIDRDGRPATNKANIAYHYDVSNDFYRLFLDKEMVYSCAYFTEDHGDIDRAQFDKLDMICRKLRLKPGDRFLDIGCGWGALVCHAAEHYGVEAHGVTLAEEQLKLARERIEARGLSGRVTLHLQDYQLLEGQFDKIASIGMFEHVGLKNHLRYFQAVNRLLAPQGLYLHHTICRRAKKDERNFGRLNPQARAIIRYIFPGGELDHLGMSIANLERTGFEVHDVEGWRENYQRTTRLWWDRLTARRAEAEALVGPEKTRLWLLYLAACRSPSAGAGCSSTRRSPRSAPRGRRACLSRGPISTAEALRGGNSPAETRTRPARGALDHCGCDRRLLGEGVQLAVMLGEKIVEGQARLGLVGLHVLADRLDRGVHVGGLEAELLLQEILAHALQLGRIGAGDVAGVGLAHDQRVGLDHGGRSGLIDGFLGELLEIGHVIHVLPLRALVFLSTQLWSLVTRTITRN